MFEIPFIEEFVQNDKNPNLLAHLAKRLPRLLEYAKKLTGAGWKMTTTMMGLAFSWPDSHCDWVDDEEEVEYYLHTLGICGEEIRFDPTPTADEVRTAHNNLCAASRPDCPDKMNVPSCCCGDDGRCPCHDEGVLHGRVATLAWVAGIDEEACAS
jgi:hypothetical protein